LVVQRRRQSLRPVLIPPGKNSGVADSKGPDNGRQGLPSLQFEQGGRPLIRPGSQSAFPPEVLQTGPIRCGQEEVLFSPAYRVYFTLEAI
jgi:hypothetical protein